MTGQDFGPNVWISPEWRWNALLLFLLCTSVYMLTAPGRLDIVDGAIRFDVTESILDVGAPLVRQSHLASVRGTDGQRYAFYPVGASLLGLPLVVIARTLDGSLESRQFAFSFASVPFAAAVVTLSFFIFGRLGCSIGQSLVFACVVAFATPLWPYAGSSFDAAIQAFFLTVAVWGSIEAFELRSPAWGFTAGVSFGCLLNLQESFAVVFPNLFLRFPISSRAIRKTALSGAGVALICGASFGVLGLFAYNELRFGNPFSTGRSNVPHPILGSLPIGLLGFFFSPAKSLLLYSPTFVATLSGFRSLIRRQPRIGETIAACFLVHLITVSSLVFWAGEWAWGPRYLIPFIPLLGLALPFATRRMRRILPYLITVGIIVQVLAISIDHQRFYFERGYPPFFWLNHAEMYRNSALLSRPFEVYDVLTSHASRNPNRLAPTATGAMTDACLGPSAELLAKGKQWVRTYVVFTIWRPWPFWIRAIPNDRRPSFWQPLFIGALLCLTGSTALLLAQIRTFLMRHQPPNSTS